MNSKWKGAGRQVINAPRSGFRERLAGCMIAMALLAVAIPAPAQSITTLQQQEQRQRARQQARERARRRRQPHAHLQKKLSTDYRQHALPTESPCFTLNSIRLDGTRLGSFRWVSAYLKQYTGRCVGQGGLNLIVKRASDLMLARGYVTTRLLIPPQNFSRGKLHLLLVPGTVGAIRYASGSVRAEWRNALPLRPGDLLNLRAIEQGLDQMRRVPSQHVHINIVPGAKPGVSDLVLNVQRTGFYHVYFSYDDAGSESTGKQQGGINIAVDQPLDINDLLSVGLTGYVGSVSGKGSQSNSLRYSVPWDDWTFAVSSNGYSYHYHVMGASKSFLTGGRARTTSLSVKRLLHRSSSAVTSVQLTLSGHEASSNIDGVDIKVQHRHTRAVTLALLQRRYIGAAQLNLDLEQSRGVPWFGGQTDAPGKPHNAPTFEYILDTFDANLRLPYRWYGRSWLWSSTLHAQYSRDRLYAENFITIGGRYTVRGFDGEDQLGGDRGWFWRNSLGVPLGDTGTRLYGGIDVGRIGGPDAPTRSGHTLSGVFIGLRGARYGFHWNFFAGWALQAPRNISTRRPAAGMQVGYQF